MAVARYDEAAWEPSEANLAKLLIGESVYVYSIVGFTQDVVGGVWVVTGGTLAALKTDETGTVASSNPFTVDAAGNLSFYTTSTEYVWVKVGGRKAYKVPLKPIVDPDALSKTSTTEQEVVSKLNFDAGIRFRKNPWRDASHPDFGCGQGGADDGPGLQAAIADGPGKLFLPPETDVSSGIYKILTPVVVGSTQTERHIFGAKSGWERGKATTIRGLADNIAMRVDGGNSLVEDLLFDGRNDAGNNVGGIGLVLGPNHKTNARSIVCRNFKEAGFVADGTQNSLWENIDSFHNKINFWATNQCRTCMLLNPNGTDSHSAINAYMDALAPEGVELWIGRRVNSYITMKTSAAEVPGDLSVIHGILERHGRHNYNVRISNGHGYIRLQDLNLQAAKAALIRIDPNVNTYAQPLRLILDNIVPQNIDNTGASIPTISNGNGDTGLQIIVPVGPGHTSFNRWFETRVKETVHTEDYGSFQHILAAPTTFGINIGSWVTQGGTATVTHVNRRLRVNIQAGFGAQCVPAPRWLSAGSGGAFIYTANHVLKVRGHISAMAPTNIKIAAELPASPWRRDIGTITAAGLFEFTYQCQGDETGKISIHAFGGAGTGNVDFSELAVTVY